MNRHTAIVVVLAVVFAAAPVRAHDLRATLSPETDPIRVEAGFDDGTPAQQARVSVVRSTGEEVAAGLTDERGVWSFARPGPGLYRITVESAGHRDVLRLTIPGGEVPNAAPEVDGDFRLDKNLGLFIGIVLLLSGSLAFIRLRARRLRTTKPASR